MQTKIHRDISGVFILDKPKGITSQQATYKVRRVFQAQKAGHTGSLDPLATGMLPICLGEATKFADYMLSANKTYQVVAQLGQCTTTGDAEGEIVKERAVTAEIIQNIDAVIPQFLGEIQQIPPMYSALKFQGQPLYRLARKGQEVERAPRNVTIASIKRLADISAQQIALEVSCSKGTYIRTLIEDIGEVLGCGAHVQELRRLEVGTYCAPNMVDLAAIASFAPAQLDKLVLPISSLVDHLPQAIIAPELVIRLQHGIMVPAVFSTAETSGKWQIISADGNFLGLGERKDGDIIVPKRLLRSGRSAGS